jgi:hypothetical protein
MALLDLGLGEPASSAASSSGGCGCSPSSCPSAISAMIITLALLAGALIIRHGLIA